MQYPKDMDKEMIPICNALNKFPGVKTFYCCSGHGLGKKDDALGDFYIMLGCNNLASLKKLCCAFNEFDNNDKLDVSSGYRFILIYNFWKLNNDEIGVRISNKIINKLDAGARRKAFNKVIKRLEKISYAA